MTDPTRRPWSMTTWRKRRGRLRRPTKPQSRGIIYEHTASTPSAERLSTEFRTLIEAQRAEGLRLTDSEVAQVIRGIETGAREARGTLPGETAAYLGLLKRVLRPPKEGPDLSLSMATENRTFVATENCTLLGRTSRAERTFSR